MNTLLLILAALLLSLGLFRRILARRRTLTQSPANSTPTAEDYEIYLTAMETAFSPNRLPSIPKAPRKPKNSKPKSPTQTPASQTPVSQAPNNTPECPTADRSIPTQTGRPKNKFLGAGKMSPKTRAAFESFLANRTFPTYERSTFASNFLDPSAASPKTSSELIRINLCSSVAINESQRKRSVLQLCLRPIHQAAHCLTTILKPFLRVPSFLSIFFRRQQPPSPADVNQPPYQNRAA